MEDLEVFGLIIPAGALAETFETSGGPGGQHANRSETAVRLRLDLNAASLPTDARERIASRLGDRIEVVAAESRSQWRNRALARRRMKEKLETAMTVEPGRRRTRPTKASQRRRVTEKRARGKTKRLRRRPDLDD
ncbi:MAG: alternative ribosome rescue aminoacyl-tRNA hydrolase ArfB [Acidimicrobiia bacterium]|jgi:ribosome-associated protein